MWRIGQPQGRGVFLQEGPVAGEEDRCIGMLDAGGFSEVAVIAVNVMQRMSKVERILVLLGSALEQRRAFRENPDTDSSGDMARAVERNISSLEREVKILAVGMFHEHADRSTEDKAAWLASPAGRLLTQQPAIGEQDYWGAVVRMHDTFGARPER